MSAAKTSMPYRRMGSSGLKLSALSFGSWVTFHRQLGTDTALECLEAAHAAGVNFFDNAEAYEGGESERVMGQAIAELGWARHTYVISTKFFFGIHDGPNTRMTLNRKYLLEAIEGSLERLGLEYVDLAYCHRPDPDTPIAETVHAMHDMIDRGQALYWGTSEWSADEIRAAHTYATTHGLHAPVVEQPEYNLLKRRRVEEEYARVIEDCGIGLTTWSPLASGLLTGKYLNGVPEDSRGALEGYGWLAEMLSDAAQNAKVAELAKIAADLDCTMAQLAIAWCTLNPTVTSVITGASRASQVVENLEAIALIPQLTPEVVSRINDACGINKEAN